MKRKPDWGYFLSLLLAVVLALLVGAAILAVTGHSPLAAYRELLAGATGCRSASEFFTALFTKRQFGNTVEYAMVLFLTGLACAIGARAGIFNVGGEGQLYLGAIVSAYIGVALNGLSAWIVVPLAVLGAVLAGGAYAFVPGVLKVKLHVNEVITTIMLNTVAIFFCAYLSNGPWKTSHPNRVSGTDVLAGEYLFPKLIRGSNLTTAIFASILIALAVWYIMSRTATGFDMRIAGDNPRFARYLGLPVDRIVIGSMVVSGMLCGLVGMFEVYGLKGNFQDGISNEYYFDGLLVAMIMGYRPAGIIFMSFFFAFLKVGAAGMELNAGIPGELYRIIQSVVIFFLAAQSGVKALLRQKRVRKGAKTRG